MLLAECQKLPNQKITCQCFWLRTEVISICRGKIKKREGKEKKVSKEVVVGGGAKWPFERAV